MLLVQLFSILSIFFVQSTSDLCSDKETAIKVVFDEPSYTLSHSRSRDWLLQRLTKEPGQGYVMQGLTLVDYGTSFYTSIISQRSGPNWCSTPKSVEVTISLQKPAEVYVASEIDFESCTYLTVLEHELEHVQIARDALFEAKTDIENNLKIELAHTFPVHGNSKEETQKKVKSAIERIIDRDMKSAISKAGIRNDAIDTPASYEQLASRCQ